METITFYSYKGGVGRTLAVANVAYYLAQLGQKVVAIDFDLEAPGLHYKLPLGVAGKLEAKEGLVDYVTSVLLNDGDPTQIEKYLTKFQSAAELPGEIWILPAGPAPHPSYWEKLSLLDWQNLIYGDGSQGAVMFLEMKEALKNALNPDFILIDSRTGITEISGVATALLADKLICMVLNSPENIEGARAVLRALSHSTRPPGAAPIKIFPVISRLPVSNASQERAFLENIRNYLNEPADELSGTLACDEVLVLHHEQSLYFSERILIGESTGSAAKIPLLQDYLRLFARVSADVVLQRTKPIIDRALERLLDYPDEAQAELESLAYSYNVREAFLQLIRVYRLRNVRGEAALRAAERLWDFRRDEDLPLLASVLQDTFTRLEPWRDPTVSLDFVEDVWRRAAIGNPELAVALAQRYSRPTRTGRDRARGLEILKQAWAHAQNSDLLLTQMLRETASAGAWAEAEAIVKQNKARLLADDKLIAEWVRMETQSPSKELPAELLETANVTRIAASAPPELYVRFLAKANRRDEAFERSLATLAHGIGRGDSDEIYQAGRALIELSEAGALQHALEQRYSSEITNAIRTAISEEAPYRMPPSDLLETTMYRRR